MELLFLIGGVFVLLTVVCWLVYRHSRTRSYLSADLWSNRNASQIPLEELYLDSNSYSHDVELGPVMTTEFDDLPAVSVDEYYDEPQSVDVGTANGRFADAAHSENVHYSDDVEVDEYEQGFSNESFAEESADDEYTDQIVEEVEHDVHQDFDEQLIEPASGFEAETSEDHEQREYREPYIGEPNIAEQTQITLLTTGANGHGINGTESIPDLPNVDVDESIEFPDSNDKFNREVDILGWIPSEGTTLSRMELLSLIRSFGEKFELPVLLYGQLVDSDTWVNFEEDSVSANYGDLMISMQLTYQGKLMSEQTWWRFFNMGEKIARSLSRSFYPSLSLKSAIRESKRVATFVQNLNIQAVLILESEKGRNLSDRTIEYLAREYQLVKLENSQVFEKLDLMSPNSAPFFTLTKLENGQNGENGERSENCGLVLFSDLPCVADPLNAFDQMVDFAWTLENRFPLTVVDEKRQKISSKDIQTIRTHIERFVDDMHYCHIVPGGYLARRLFDEPNPYLMEIDDREVANLSLERW